MPYPSPGLQVAGHGGVRFDGTPLRIDTIVISTQAMMSVEQPLNDTHEAALEADKRMQARIKVRSIRSILIPRVRDHHETAGRYP